MCLLTVSAVYMFIPFYIQYSDSYKSLNPQCLVPTLEVDGLVLTESVSTHIHTVSLHSFTASLAGYY